MNKKIIVCLLLFAFLLTVSLVDAQQAEKVPRIGYLTGSSVAATAPRIEAFRQALRELGYFEGKNIVVEWRSWEGKRDRQRPLAAELVRLKVDVIVAVGAGEIRAAKEATATIPIVMIIGGDPVGSGFVASLARPGGNITGTSTFSPELSGKRLELLKEIVPKLSRVAVFWTSSSGSYAPEFKEVELAARALEIKLQNVDVLGPKDISPAFQAAAAERSEAVLMNVSGRLMNDLGKKIPELAVKSRLPVVYERATDVEAGGLISYGVNRSDLYHRAATYVDKIFKGAKPAELPVQQPMKFELVINLKTAKQIGLTIPDSVLFRADRVIK